MKNITPHLWFDKEAREAAEFYTSVFDDSKIGNMTTLHDTPSGDCDLIAFELFGQPFMAISAGPFFKFNPSVSFQIKCSSKDEVEAHWKKLSDGGAVLMELGEYPFSEKFGWCADRFGLSWQVIVMGESDIKQRITPMLLFVGNNSGRAEEAIDFYTSVFDDGEIRTMMRYGPGEEPDEEGTVKHALYSLLGTEFAAMDSAHEHAFEFNESISFMVNCDTQEEMDYYSTHLSAAPESEQCGWLKDKYGLSWQITPAIMSELLQDKDEKKVARVIQALLKMKKLDIETLQRAYREE